MATTVRLEPETEQRLDQFGQLTGRTVAETLEIARDLARRLLEAQQEKLISDHTLGEQSDTLRYY